MLNGAFALLEQSLRLDSRSRSTHWVRFGLCVAIYVSLCMTLKTRNSFSAPGLQFFQATAYLDLCFLTLLGIGFFSMAITEEKEEDTLGLMMMAGISPLGILGGKSGGRLCQALLLVAVQYPFLLLAVTMGGVTTHQIWSMTFAILAYVVFLSGLGLFCSTIAPRNRTAGMLMIFGLVVYFVVPVLAKGLAWLHMSGHLSWTKELNLSVARWNQLEAFGDVCVYLQMMRILASGFGDSSLSLQVISNVAFGLMFAGLSWLLFGIATRSPSTETDSRGLVARQRGTFRFPAGRCWGNPFAWKDFHFVGGGIGMILVRFVYYLGLVAIACGSEMFLGVRPGAWSEICLTWIMLSLPVDAALLMARAMHDEVRAQTLSALMMLPRSSNGIVYSKLAGALIGWFPGPLVGLCVLLGSEFGRSGLNHMTTHNEGWAVPIAVLYFALVPNFAALAALYVRWGAVPLAIGLTIGAYFAVFICMMIGVTLVTGGTMPPPTRTMEAVIITFVGIAFLAINVGCHIGVLFRVQALAEK